MTLELTIKFPYEDALRNQMAIISNGQIKMANLCVEAAHSVNGVSQLHSEIIQKDIFNGFYKNEPEKFTNVTNGIAYRRWLCQANPRLSELIEELTNKQFRHINSTCDVEAILNVFADELKNTDLARFSAENVFKAVSGVFKRVAGSYSVVGLIADKGVFAFRDPHGIKPLVIPVNCLLATA